MAKQPPTEVKIREDEANFADSFTHSTRLGLERHGRNYDGD